MKIGISSGNFGVHTDSMDPAALGKRAEDLGFESFFMPEHTIFPVDCVSPYVGTLDGSRPEYLSHQADPLITLARVSAATQKLKLGTAVLLVPEHEPMLLAKQIATLDYLSGGRFIFGIGAGWNREESEILGGDFEVKSPADEISMYDGINPDVVESFADVGVERVVFQTRTNRGEEALRVIERLAERVLR